MILEKSIGGLAIHILTFEFEKSRDVFLASTLEMQAPKDEPLGTVEVSDVVRSVEVGVAVGVEKVRVTRKKQLRAVVAQVILHNIAPRHSWQLELLAQLDKLKMF